ncbi:uroporphyrinogen decarboxylase [Elstera cyanobacteriorum]|uniref:Uroporphyrinogen decarboxylase n=1 Tax=Elstera cyanobacteriorum TaxID=2022747 RepID=A0A255XUQ4_9PROT|nr:uroporphyrinogen decarboxylase [Elstera cyanobacteriorum]OYQ20642.1 uroporphyrinogen decarboxylase [Elstera cyanobacteriorum]GFZ99991.1 uroporphyrinogen decarboxylase [Elstera cyanobacteriorum]
MSKHLLAALKGQTTARPPFWFMRQAGRYLPEYRALRQEAGGFLAMCLNPDRAAEITLQPIRRYGMDGAILFSDILIVPMALGQSLKFAEGEGPVLGPLPESLDFTGAAVVYAPVIETVRRVKAALPSETTFLGFAGSPWTVATYMVEGGSSRDFGKTKSFFYSQPKAFEALLNGIVTATVDYLSAQIDAGADAVQLFDSWAGALAPLDYERWVIEPNRQIVAALRARHPETPIIAFPRGSGALYKRFTEIVQPTCIAIDTQVPPDWAAEVLQPLACVQGNLDPLALVAGGKSMLAAAEHICGHLGRGPFIFNLGHGIVPQTPPEHVAALCDFLRRI